MDHQHCNDDSSNAEGVRRKYLYRRLVMNRGIKIPLRLAKKLVGPDCAYHLYSHLMPEKEKSKKDSSCVGHDLMDGKK